MAELKKRGGQRTGAGRPTADIQLSKETARTLHLIIKMRGFTGSAHDYVAALIEADWDRIDAPLVTVAKEGTA